MWLWPWATKAPENMGCPFDISAMAVASDFKFGKELGFAKSNYKITPKDKSERGPRVVSSEKFGIPL